ncbi:MAG: FAD:protein FMN transferase [Saprospiraceae bacterium]
MSLFLLLTLPACRQGESPYTHLEGNAQGTTFRIVYDDGQRRDFSHDVDSLFRQIDRSMSLWDPSSVISRINRNDPNVRADEHFTKVYHASRAVSEATGGAFDCTVGPLVKVWGFSYKKGLPPPDSLQVDSLLALIGFQKIRLEEGALIKTDTSMEVDFNAIAQGYTVDLMAAFLEKKGVRNYLVEIGGELRTLGVNDRGKPWNIGIDKPESTPGGNARHLQTTISLSDRSLATSGSYRKFIVRDGKKYSHAIDPATGYPVTHKLLSVSVLAGDCTTADAYATAFLVMGMEKALEMAAQRSLEIYCIYEDDSGALKVRATPGFGK